MPDLTDDECNELQNTLVRLLADHSTESDVRKTMATETGFVPAFWPLRAEMGSVGLPIDESSLSESACR